MTIAVLGTETTTNFGTSSAAYTPSVNSYLVVYCVANGADITAVSDGTNTYTKQGSAEDTTHSWFLAIFTSSKITTSTSYTIGCTTTGTTPAIWIAEIGGSSGFQTFTGQWQSTPGTGSNGISSGLLGTLSAAPALIHAVSFGSNGGTAPTAGSGFTAGTTTGAAFGGAANSENERVTVTTSVAATFTAPSNTDYVTVASVWTEIPSFPVGNIIT